jgi:hypothetical protein
LPADGTECGIGVSFQGRIPSLEAIAAVTGTQTSHVVVDGKIPLPNAMELDGTATMAFGSQGIHVTARGDLNASLPFLDGLIGFSVPVGDAALQMDIGPDRYNLAFDGNLGGKDIVLPLPIPVTFPPQGRARMSGQLRVERGADAVFRVHPDSFYEGSGQIGMGLDSFGALIGMPLNKAAVQGAFRLDRTGLSASGAIEGQIHPSVQVGANAQLEAFVAFTDPAASFFALRGAMQVGSATERSARCTRSSSAFRTATTRAR